MLPARDTKFTQFISPCVSRPEPWRLAVGIIAFVAMVMGASYAMRTYGLKIAELYKVGYGYMLAVEVYMQFSKRSVLISIGLIAISLPMLWLVVRVIHKRKFRSLFGPSGGIHWRIFAAIVVVFISIWLVLSLPLFLTSGYQQQLALPVWLLWLLPACLLIFLQVTTEELIFRGYLLQQFGVIFDTPVMGWLVPSVLFGAMHYNPVFYGENAWVVSLNAFVFGLILADITMRTGNLTAAIALHFANNFIQICVLGIPGILSSISLFLRAVDIQNVVQTRQVLFVSLAVMVVAYSIYLLVVRRRR